MAGRDRYLYVIVGILTLLAVGWRNSISIYYQHLMSFYGITNVTQVAAFVVISSGVGALASSVLGALSDKKGPSIPLAIGALAQLFSGFLVLSMKFKPWSEAVWSWYTAAVVAGIVFPSVAVTVNPTVMKTLSSRPQLALAIVQSGSYMAFTIWSPTVAYLIARFDPFLAYLIASLVTFLAVLACAASYRKVGHGENTKHTNIDVEKRGTYLLILIPIFFVATSSIMMTSYLAPMISEISEASGVAYEEATLIITPTVMAISGILQVAGGFFWVVLAARLGVLSTLLALYAVQSASSYSVSILSGGNMWLAISALLIRLFAFGGEPVIHMSVIPALIGMDSAGRAVGLQISVVMFSSIVGPILGGIARDITGTYFTIAILSSLLTVAAMLILVLLWRTLKELRYIRSRSGTPAK